MQTSTFTSPTLFPTAWFPSTSSRPTTREGSTSAIQHSPPPPPPAIPLPPPPKPNTQPPPIPGNSASSPFTPHTTTIVTAAPPALSSKERKSSFSRKGSFPTPRRRGSSTTSTNTTAHAGVVTNAAAPPALPDYALAAAAKIVFQPPSWGRESRPGTSGGSPSAGIGLATTTGSSGQDTASEHQETVRSPESPEDAFGGRTLSRTTTATSTNGVMYPTNTAQSAVSTSNGQPYQPGEVSILHQQITEVANKRISTLDYIRKAHEGRIYWFNTYLFDKPDLHRMPYFDHRKLARKATNYLLLGLSLPTISDLYASTPSEFLRSLNLLLSEFDSFQQLHSSESASLSRARLPNMFRRPGVKSRRSTSAAEGGNGNGAGKDSMMIIDDGMSNGVGGGGGSGAGQGAHPIMNFAASESDLFPGEEYTHLLTPSLPFDPDYFETFATLCDVLIEVYTKFLTLIPSPKASASVADLFNKVDAKVRKIIVQGVVKEFEEHGRTHVKAEVANVGKVVLGGLM